MRILTWHVHGTYLQALGRVPHQFLVPVAPGRPARHVGLPPGRRWADNLQEVDAESVSDMDIDGILYQADENWTVDQYRILTDEQRSLPRMYLEHDPPGHDGGSSFASRHPVGDPEVTIVHVTHFNDLMWDCGSSQTAVIEHGVPDRGSFYTGDLDHGVVVVNNIARRGRRLGLDVYEAARSRVPLDLVGMGSEEVAGGLGEVPPDELSDFVGRYRFFFHPIRYTSLGMALCEAMMAGLPVIALATTEAVTVIENGVNGFIGTDLAGLVDAMEVLIADPEMARQLGVDARQTALRRFSLDRFATEWDHLIRQVCSRGTGEVPYGFGDAGSGRETPEMTGRSA